MVRPRLLRDEAPEGAVMRPRRRTVLSMLLSTVATAATLTPSAVALPLPPDPPPAWHFLPRRRGTGDGSDWANAASFGTLTAMVAQAPPGQSVLLGFPDNRGPLTWAGTQIRWNRGGEAEAPLRLEFGLVGPGAGFRRPDVPGAQPLLRMAGRDTGADGRPDTGGRPFVVFGPQSAHLQVSGPVYLKSGGGGFFNIDAGGPVRNLSFSGIHARRAGRVIETERGTVIEQLLVEQCSALGLIRGFARFFDLSQAEFRDLDLDADLLDGGGGAVCQILSVVRGTDLSFTNVRLARAVNSLAAEERGSTYIQGDGIVLEEETRRVRIDNCHAEDMGDGGFDLKTNGVHMTNCTATRCKLGIRIWSHDGENLIEACRVTQPVSRPFNEGSCLWVAGSVTARDCEFHSAGDMPPIRFGPGADRDRAASLRIEGGVITHSEAAGLVDGSPGELTLENVSINGREVSGRFRWNGRRLRRRWWSPLR